ncbi:hypothetical protein HMPREF2534_04305 [Bacteroides thetaiotaomicron]|nr:hypothetical protein HMPREF2534_04305 [Bacteroides thetaiotaomicron]
MINGCEYNIKKKPFATFHPIHFLKTRLIINILSFLVYHTIKPYLCHRQIIFITNMIRYYHYYDKVTSLL